MLYRSASRLGQTDELTLSLLIPHANSFTPKHTAKTHLGFPHIGHTRERNFLILLPNLGLFNPLILTTIKSSLTILMK